MADFYKIRYASEFPFPAFLPLNVESYLRPLKSKFVNVKSENLCLQLFSAPCGSTKT